MPDKNEKPEELVFHLAFRSIEALILRAMLVSVPASEFSSRCSPSWSGSFVVRARPQLTASDLQLNIRTWLPSGLSQPQAICRDAGLGLAHAKMRLFLFCVAVGGWSAFSQTNTPVVPLEALRLPPTELHFGSPERQPSLTLADQKVPAGVGLDVTNTPLAVPVRIPSTNDVPDQMSLSSQGSDFDQRMYRRLEEGGYLTRMEQPSDNLFVRATDGIFRPEVVHFRKIEISCSLITAIKRKNPLCLINPIFFSASW